MKSQNWYLSLCVILSLQVCAENVELINHLPASQVDQNGDRMAVLQRAGTLKYPKALLKESVEGLVILEYEITQTGSVRGARVLFSDPAGLFDSPAIETISQWTFLPKLVHGAAVVSTRRNVMTFCADPYPKPANQRFRPCRSDAERAAYLAENSRKYQEASNATAAAP
jgi:TonB family protein